MCITLTMPQDIGCSGRGDLCAPILWRGFTVGSIYRWLCRPASDETMFDVSRSEVDSRSDYWQVNPVLNGAPASILPNDFKPGLNADNKNEWVTVVMLSHVYALKVGLVVAGGADDCCCGYCGHQR